MAKKVRWMLATGLLTLSLFATACASSSSEEEEEEELEEEEDKEEQDEDAADADDGQASSEDSSDGTDTAAVLTAEEARDLALEAAGVSEEDTESVYVETETDDGREIYDVNFYVNGTEYDYEYDASSGELLYWGYDSSSNSESTKTGENVGESVAVEMVLAEVEGASSSNVEIELETEDGIDVYTGELDYNDTLYEFTIDACSTEILKWSEEYYTK